MRALLSLLSFLFAANFVFAADVGLDEAKNFALRWRGRGVRAARTHKTAAGESRFHVVSFEGGGWAAIGADDEDAPVIAFSDNGEDLVEDERNAVWFLVKRDAERRAKGREVSRKERKGRKGRHKGWERVKTATAAAKTSVADSALEDIRVAPMLKSTWNQGSVGTNTCYNYYTPNNYVCGCVATMMAQIMRYHEWPRGSVEAKSKFCKVWTTSKYFSMIGGVYDWSKMSLSPTSSTAEDNRREIGKLCYDCGVSVRMSWASEGSGAYMYYVAKAFTDDFRYIDAKYLCETYQSANEEYKDLYTDYPDEFKSIVISNCEKRLPIAYGIGGLAAGGHAVVIDGYGYSGGSFLVHINPGWGGKSNAWYCPPDLAMGGYNFVAGDELIYDITPPRFAKVLFR